MKAVAKFKKGDIVCWSSQSGGFSKNKVGMIVAIVKSGEQPSAVKYPTLHRGAGCGLGRKDVSYVVEVGTKIYWPLASKLEKVA